MPNELFDQLDLREEPASIPGRPIQPALNHATTSRPLNCCI
jgi:hypothetical protein